MYKNFVVGYQSFTEKRRKKKNKGKELVFCEDRAFILL